MIGTNHRDNATMMDGAVLIGYVRTQSERGPFVVTGLTFQSTDGDFFSYPSGAVLRDLLYLIHEKAGDPKQRFTKLTFSKGTVKLLEKLITDSNVILLVTPQPNKIRHIVEVKIESKSDPVKK